MTQTVLASLHVCYWLYILHFTSNVFYGIKGTLLLVWLKLYWQPDHFANGAFCKMASKITGSYFTRWTLKADLSRFSKLEQQQFQSACAESTVTPSHLSLSITLMVGYGMDGESKKRGKVVFTGQKRIF